MIHGQSFEAHIASDLDILWCCECGRTFDERTVAHMDDRSLPCPCGERQANKLSKVDPHMDPETADPENVTTIDEVVDLIVDSGFWRCLECGFIAPESGWEKQAFGPANEGTVRFVTCTRCEEVETYEVLRIK